MAFTYVRPDGPILTQIVALLGAGDILPNISRTFGLSDAAEAHRLGEGGHVSGKLVLDLGDTGWR